MGKWGIGAILGLGAVGLIGFIAVDHFVLKDRFGIWLKIAGLLKRPQVTYTPRGGRLDVTGKGPEEVSAIQENIEKKAAKMQSDFEKANARADSTPYSQRKNSSLARVLLT